ncbi:MAG: hypothetical protein AB1758_31790, partial [Candidatus Eremiobacterota bacterium]
MDMRIDGFSPANVLTWNRGTTAQARPLDTFRTGDPLDRLNVPERLHLMAALSLVREAAGRPYYDAEADAAARRDYYGDLADRAGSLDGTRLFH